MGYQSARSCPSLARAVYGLVWYSNALNKRCQEPELVMRQ